MKNTTKLISNAATLVALGLTPTLSFADADIAVQAAGVTATAEASVDFCVIIPEILIFGVGETGDTISKIEWDVSPSGVLADTNNQTYGTGGAPVAITNPDPFGTTPTTSVTAGVAGSSTSGAAATLPVFLFSNTGGDVTITSTVVGGNAGASALEHDTIVTATIPTSEIVATDGGSIAHPTADFTTDTVITGGAVINLTDTWTYTYTRVAGSTTPVAGTYEARVTYVASQP